MGRELSFHARKKIRLVLVALCVLGVALYVLTGAGWARAAMIAALAVYIVFHIVLWRCPACNAPVGGGILIPRQCYRCGESLED